MSNNRSVLRFEKFLVIKVAFDANEEFLNIEKEVDLDFDFDTKSNVDGNTMEIELSVNIFDDAVKNGYPFEMKVILKGFFSIDNEGEVKDISIFETNAIAILFPYLRAIVSSYTANANVAPVLLPAMNINEYIRRKYQNGEKQA